ncbi:protoporphyrinogen oxidase [Pochonia chlamydosporia 170]|uniref:Protoporphyrinogen oxidase n=1 Tax=Pochonia chlamydosporia 170 TaxID=1380566 RepID=A0A179FFY6_METCM|nr:protoporphyrinogen oxidase [Pochonia chlamydosporia 170]OAQ64258.2 protoporphyrinogen oxidase [Pochonia chlamydosporia 170]
MARKRAKDSAMALLSLSSAIRTRSLRRLTLARHLATSTSTSQNDIAVLGGGLTGLTTAYYLAKQLPPTAKITLYEGTSRLGGWIRTDRLPVDVDGTKGTVSFERGPRTLSSNHLSTWKFDDLVLYDLALDLGLKVVTPPDQPRYIYYPDHLVTLPPAGSFAEFFREPLFLQSLWGGLGFLLRRMRSRAVPLKDMSVSEWLYEISGSRAVAENVASAMIHGIYGGDIDRLSARSVFDRFYWAYYLPSMGSDLRQMTMREQTFMSELSQDPQIRRMALKAKGALLHFGKEGMDSLPRALADALEGTPNVEIRKGIPVRDISYDAETEKVNITTGNWADEDQQHLEDKTTSSYDRVISTIASQDLASITGSKLPSLAETHSVSIMTVNMWYPKKHMKPPGFGYLIPRSVSREHNTERALGVFYDSDVGGAASPDEPEGTKLFVLMGGHYYDSGAPPPSESDAIEQAKSLLERHLGIPADTPCFAVSRFAKECIPQHYVGHNDRMMQVDQQLRDEFHGKLAVAGGSYSKIGAMGAIRAGYDIAKQTVGEGGWYTTGLESLEFPEPFVGVPISKIPVRRFRQLEQNRERA